MWFTSMPSGKLRPKIRSTAPACRPKRSWQSWSGPEAYSNKKRDAGRSASLFRRFLFGRLIQIYVGENRRQAAERSARPNNKNPEVMLISFVSASSSLLDPRRPALVASLRVTTRDLG